MYKLRTRKPLFLALIPIFTLVLVLLFCLPHFTNRKNSNLKTTPKIHIEKHNLRLQLAHSTCEGTRYPQLCVSTLSSFPNLTTKSLTHIISSLINYTLHEVKSSSSNCTGLRNKLRNLHPLENRALDDCIKLFDDTVDELNITMINLSNTKMKSKHKLQTLLSAAMTNLYTCLDGFAYTEGNVRHKIQDRLLHISHHVSNSLAMLKKVPVVRGLQVKKASESDQNMFPEYGNMMKSGFPSWVSSKERKLLETNVSETRFDIVVAKDGSGNFTTIGEALAAAPNSSTTRHVH